MENRLRSIFKNISKLACLAAILFSQVSHAQSTDNESRVKALFIYGFTKYVDWPDQHRFENFKIAILGEDSLLYDELKKIANTKTFSGKPFKILSFKSISEITNCQILYVNRKSAFDIEQVLRAIQDKKTLLVSEEYTFNTSMINFITIDNIQRFEVNVSKITNEGLAISKELVALSTTLEEWQKHYNSLQVKLISEKHTAELQKQEIERLKKIQDKQQAEIEIAKKELQEQELSVRNQKLQLETLLRENAIQQQGLNEKIETLQKQDKEIKEKEKKMIAQELNVLYQNEILTRQLKQIEIQQNKIETQKNMVIENERKMRSQQKSLNISFISIVIIAILFAIALRNYRVKQKANTILEEKNRAIELQKKQIEEKNLAITSSILYAKKIQEAILPSEEVLNKLLPEYFIFNQPKDIVSGDFYWAYHSNESDKTIVAVADCTGHGVPGAFMSLIGHSLLNEIVIENKIEESDEILNHLKEAIISSLNQKGSTEEAKDGMDIALCIWDRKNNKLLFSGAHNSLYLIRGKELHQMKGDSQGIGFNRLVEKNFEKKEIQIQKNDIIYLFSDGFVDQKGGPLNKKFYYKPFRELLLSISDLPMKKQGEILSNTFNNWKKSSMQMDDVCILGAKLM